MPFLSLSLSLSLLSLLALLLQSTFTRATNTTTTFPSTDCRSRPLLSAQPNLLTYPPLPYRLRPAKRAALPLTRPVLRTPTVELHSRLRYQRNLLLSFRIPLSHEFHTRGNRFCVWFCCESFRRILFSCVEFYEYELFRRGRGLCG